jgi:hypothetical protein
MKKPTISDIANNTKSHYFDKDTLKFFGQKRSSFKVFSTDVEGVFETVADRNIDGEKVGVSKQFWKFENGSWVIARLGCR